jgi:hypothetical protein
MTRDDNSYRSDRRFIDEERESEEAFGLLDGDDDDHHVDDDVPAEWSASNPANRRRGQNQAKNVRRRIYTSTLDISFQLFETHS